MAILSSGSLCLEIRMTGRDMEDWIRYEIFFRYKGKPIFDDRILKFRDSSRHWNTRPFGGILGEDCDEDELITTMQRALETGEPQYFEALDPGFLVAVYPDRIFPFMPSNRIKVYQSDDLNQQAMDEELIRELAGGNLPGDPVTIIVRVDSFNFGDEIAYSMNGPALILTSTRYDVQQFIDDLQKEYEATKHL